MVITSALTSLAAEEAIALGNAEWNSPLRFHPFITFGYPDVAALGGAVAITWQSWDNWRVRPENGPCVVGRLGTATGQLGAGWQFGDSGKFGPALVRLVGSTMTMHRDFMDYQRGDRFVGLECQGQALILTMFAGILHGIDSDDDLVVMGIGFGL